MGIAILSFLFVNGTQPGRIGDKSVIRQVVPVDQESHLVTSLGMEKAAAMTGAAVNGKQSLPAPSSRYLVLVYFYGLC